METAVILLCVVVVLTLIFDFINGFHDAANAIATVVSTRVMRPTTAVLYGGILNFAGAFWVRKSPPRSERAGRCRM
jgi:PiT family inorganic phosphate transporter